MRFGWKYDATGLTLWDNQADSPMTQGGEPIRFEAKDDAVYSQRPWVGICEVMNQRVEHPELTRADGKLVSV